jgi:hypothetical protein
LLARLDRRLAVLTGGRRDAPARQQTLRAALDWSHELLRPDEQTLLRRLSVFAGGCTLEAAEAVGAGSTAAGIAPSPDVLEGVAALVDQSLLRREEQPDGTLRLGMLETVREYALERLEASGEAAAVGARHATHYLALAERAAPELRGRREAAWLGRLAQETGNLRAALRWWTDRADAAGALRLAGALGWFWALRGRTAEGRRWLADALALPGAAGAGGPRARALAQAGGLALLDGAGAAARAHGEQATAAARRAGDRWAEALGLAVQAAAAISPPRDGAAARLAAESVALARAAGDGWLLALALATAGRLAYLEGDGARAARLLSEGLATARAQGEGFALGYVLRVLGGQADRRGDPAAARGLYAASLDVQRRTGDERSAAETLAILGRLAADHGDAAAARACYEESLALGRALGSARAAYTALTALGELALRRGDDE